MDARTLIQDLVDAGLTQTEIAEGTGLRQASVSKVLRGQVKDVLSQNYLKLLALHTDRLPAPRRRAKHAHTAKAA